MKGIFVIRGMLTFFDNLSENNDTIGSFGGYIDNEGVMCIFLSFFPFSS